MFYYSYKGYTISHEITSNVYFITYPGDNLNVPPSVYTFSLEKAYQFINEMTK